MKAVIQRVLRGSVSVNGETISSIGRGFVVLIGIHQDDTTAEMDYIVKKILSVRLFEGDDEKRWSKSVVDKQYEVLCVSQFTLYHTLKGNKPDFRRSMKADESQRFYENFLCKLRNTYSSERVKDGVFGAMMQVDICNDGPVTIELESIPQRNLTGTDSITENTET